MSQIGIINFYSKYKAIIIIKKVKNENTQSLSKAPKIDAAPKDIIIASFSILFINFCLLIPHLFFTRPGFMYAL